MLGWLGSQLALRAAVLAGDISAWLTLVLFSFSFVATLSATVVILNLAGRELGIRALLPEEERAADDRDTSLGQLLAVTLLPFLGMYAAFGQVEDAANGLAVEQTVRVGAFGEQTVLAVLSDAAANHLPWLIVLIAGLYVARRLIDAAAERTGWRVLSLLVVLIESFFLVMLIMGGIRVFQTFVLWLEDRAVLGWFATVQDALARALAVLRIDLPEVLLALRVFFVEQIWPVLFQVLSQPLLWLAVAALVYGSRVLSLAELWRKGQPYAARIPGASRFASYRDKQIWRRVGPPPRGARLAAEQARQAFFGDIDDKYLPTFHALRLVLRAGVLFLGSYVLVYSLIAAAENLSRPLIYRLTGGHAVEFWVRWSPLIDVSATVLLEPLRLCLLAVAFRRCLELFHDRVTEPGPAAPRLDWPAPEPQAAP